MGSGEGTTLHITAVAAATGQAYGLTLGATTLSGNLDLSVANNTNGGGNAPGTLTLGAIGDGNGGFGITTRGPGAVMFAAGNTYSGPTTLASGTLRLADGSPNNIADSPKISIGDAAILDVAGLAGGTLTLGYGGVVQTLAGPATGPATGHVNGNIAVSSGSEISAASSAVLAIGGSLTLQTGARSSFALTSAGADNASALVAAATLVGPGAGNSHTLIFTGTAAVGDYDLYAFNDGAPPAGAFVADTSALAGGDFRYQITASDRRIDLIVSPAASAAAWNGNGSPLDYGDASNWDPQMVPNGAGSMATFGDGTTHTIDAPSVEVTIGGAQAVASLVFDNSQGTNYLLARGGAGAGLTIDNNGQAIGGFTGGSIVVAAIPTSGNPAPVTTIDADLTLADNLTVNVGPGNTLLLGGGAAGAILNEVGGSRNLTITGGGTLTIDRPSTYTGTTRVANATVNVTADGSFGSAGPLVVNGSAGNISIVNLSNRQTVASLSGSVDQGGTVRVAVAAGASLAVTGGSTFGGQLVLAGSGTARGGGTLVKSGSGVFEIDSAPDLGDNSNIQVSGGTLKLALPAGGDLSGSIGTGVVVTLTDAGILELAGAGSALDSGDGETQAAIQNDSLSPGGLHSSGTNEIIGSIDGSGTTWIDAGSDLQAGHIIQGALVIGGDATHPAVVTIAGSVSHGNPSAANSNGFVLAESLLTAEPAANAGLRSADPFAADAVPRGDSPSLGSSAIAGLDSESPAAAVPEPASMRATALGLPRLGPIGLATLARRASEGGGTCNTSPTRKRGRRNVQH